MKFFQILVLLVCFAPFAGCGGSDEPTVSEQDAPQDPTLSADFYGEGSGEDVDPTTAQ
ncbi:MAG: hypothetical protein WBD20_14215 [Pirellulaceae bacterium]